MCFISLYLFEDSVDPSSRTTGTAVQPLNTPGTSLSQAVQPQGTPATYKQSSISRGTLHWQHQRGAGDTRAHAVSDSPITKSVAFDSRPTHDQRSSNMASMLNADRARSRRERTFVGGECAACEELLEHTLRGERVLQFSCGHVAHEACFYEYIKDADCQYCPTCDAPLGLDTARGGSILDLGM